MISFWIFLGSGTTAHAIFEQNKEDGISQKYYRATS
jgi:adenine specific DNA methylase Mod